MDEKDTKPTQEDLLKAVADVIDEALVEYDELTKSSDLAKMGQGIDYAQAIDDHKGDGSKAQSPDGSTGEGTGAADNSGAGAMTKEDDDKDEKDKKDKDEDDDDKLMRTYKSVCAKMEARGLMSKTDVAKSENAPVAVAPGPDYGAAITSLQKSYDEKFESFGKTLGAIGESVKKIAAQPAAPRKGLTGQTPLRKNEEDEAPSLRKSEVVDKLLDLKKSGDKRLEGAGGSSLINRVETNRVMPADIERIKSILN